MNENEKARRSVLVVEDEQALRMALRKEFTRAGFICFEAVNGHEGLQMALKEKPDAIILDLLMPKMGGMDMLEKLREDSWGHTAPVVLLTNVNELDMIAKATSHGVTDYLVKSEHSLADVVKLVNEKVGKRS